MMEYRNMEEIGVFITHIIFALQKLHLEILGRELHFWGNLSYGQTLASSNQSPKNSHHWPIGLRIEGPCASTLKFGFEYPLLKYVFWRNSSTSRPQTSCVPPSPRCLSPLSARVSFHSTHVCCRHRRHCGQPEPLPQNIISGYCACHTTARHARRTQTLGRRASARGPPKYILELWQSLCVAWALGAVARERACAANNRSHYRYLAGHRGGAVPASDHPNEKRHQYLLLLNLPRKERTECDRLPLGDGGLVMPMSNDGCARFDCLHSNVCFHPPTHLPYYTPLRWI